MSDAIARAKARIETALESIRGLTYGDHAPSATQRSYDEALSALDALVAEAERLERERDEALAERDQWKANVATVGYVMDEGRAQSTARIRALESALRQLGERGDALAATAVPTIDEGESPALATARAHWIAERIAARALATLLRAASDPALDEAVREMREAIVELEAVGYEIEHVEISPAEARQMICNHTARIRAALGEEP